MQERPIYFYMTNLWSEVEKIFLYKERGEKKAIQSALNRALSIIEKIKSFENKSATSEVAILENILTDLALNKEDCLIDRAQISAYLNPFALRVVGSLG